MQLVTLELKVHDEDMIELCRQYWEMDAEGRFMYSVKSLGEQHAIKPTEVPKLVSASCVAVSLEKFCEDCGTPQVFKTRSAFMSRNQFRQKWRCSACSEKQRPVALAAPMPLNARQRVVIRRTVDASKSAPFGTPDILEMPLEHAVYLLALVRLNGTENFERIYPLTIASRPLTALYLKTVRVIQTLFDHRYIVVHEESEPAAFTFENDHITNFYLMRVTYAVRGPNRIDRAKSIQILENVFREKSWPDSWYYQQHHLWRQVVIDEALAYLTHMLLDYDFSFEPGEKTIAMLNRLFEDYSLGQVYNFIWHGVKDAAAFYLRTRASKQHAIHVAIRSIQQRADRAKAERWDIKNFERDSRCPEPMVSEVLFNTVLQIGREGFNQKPCNCVFPPV